jgi:hypothetical protein
MPCRAYEDDYEDDETPIQLNDLRTKNDKLTRMLCEVMRVSDGLHLAGLSSEVVDWWRQHLQQDERRRKSEREQFFKKLNKLIYESDISTEDAHLVMKEIIFAE